ncbi:pyridoxal-phosphate-dependent aminotransferase family protein [Paenibacillus silvae]|uniref:Aminotransferase n=1 Tax=Paenibacillus silvae TaxID=1325358 RepID=A0A2W6NM73_9BACL|nr:alanine--glyoxylate aminotransferase family protein [Paenibacillus silvae]MCK6075648.1 alanine--glyoxylate aminotransferase family protein [Paenibacillus silvae]MCK6150035.1 alanine--glyoxylate aminotransferase family protein [Paenibacillus silvae]MCK6268333.1 alanine--glyoxylate aminotransferase family protein [Paenibacillus silvae]PZT56977.1 aminotransferase [Paenibacillus silvae]
MTQYREINAPLRTIMTPGPVEVDPRVLRAMSTPVLGQFDPEFTRMMNETMDMLRQTFQTTNQWAFPVDGTSRSGLEAVLCSLIEPGDKVLVPIFGRFGHLLTEIAERQGAELHLMECPWGQVFDQQAVIDEVKRVQPKILAIVHGETSTGCMQPLDLIGPACRELGVLTVVDAVASIGGTPVKVDEWQLDAVIGGTQKCISVPSGMAPVTYNERVERILTSRKKVERGVALDSDRRDVAHPIRSNYFDLSQLQDYWGPRRLNHHTEATSMLYALREGLRILLEEGLEARFTRHKLHEQALMAGIRGMGLELFNDVAWKLPVVTCVKIPAGVDGEAVRTTLLKQFGIEIASSFGPLHGQIWRIGTMGYSCRKENVLFVLAALEAVLIRNQAPIVIGRGVQEALDVYEHADSSC